MKALVWHGDRQMAVEQVQEPQTASGQVAFEVGLAGICGSDLHGYRGHPGPRVPPLVLGHEAVGTVAGRPGRFVPFPLAVCGECAACRRGEEHLCAQRGLLGLDRPGVFAERVAVPAASLLPVPDAMSDAVAAITEPYAVGLSAVRTDGIAPGMDVLVIGTGTIGALTVHAAQAAGARVDAADGIALRRDVAARLGARDVLEDADRAPARQYDVVFDCVGVEATVLAGIRAVRRGGRVTIVGLGAAVGAMPLAELVREALTIRGHYAYTREHFEQALLARAEDPPDLSWLTTLPLAEGEAGFRGLVDHPDTYAKVLLDVRDGTASPSDD
jgi:threonine dehydrogenase-like Zn-dependent dehydrogenase